MIENDAFFSELATHFAIDGAYVSCIRYGAGHINDTFCLTVEREGVRTRTFSNASIIACSKTSGNSCTISNS